MMRRTSEANLQALEEVRHLNVFREELPLESAKLFYLEQKCVENLQDGRRVMTSWRKTDRSFAARRTLGFTTVAGRYR